MRRRASGKDAMNRTRWIRFAVVLVATLFGLATIVAGMRVLTGGDPGYVVYRPLLVYNTVMGLAYLAGAVLAWRNTRLGRNAAGAIFALNAVVLAAVAYLYGTGGVVAIDSVRAMVLRTVVWLVLWLALLWSHRAEARGR